MVEKMENNNHGCNMHDDNFDLLMKKICNELKKGDKNKNGLIMYNTFIDVLDLFQIEYGSSIIDYLMKHCVVTEDGFVNYKNLWLIHDPSKTMRNNSESVEESINPKFMDIQDRYEDVDKYTQEKNEIIRKLYSQWDKCLLRDDEFKAKLINGNIDITPEFERSLYLYGPSRSLSFANVMKTLYINDSKNRKNRNNFVSKIKDEKWRKLNIDENEQQCFQDIHRNPIAWEGSNVTDADNLIQNVELISNYLRGEENVNMRKEEFISHDFFNNTVKNLIKNYISNKISESEFYLCLNKLNISVTPQLNNLIKCHELDSNGKFKDFATTINRCIPKNLLHSLQRRVQLYGAQKNDKDSKLNFSYNNCCCDRLCPNVTDDNPYSNENIDKH
ncbi:conserved Plasmodium protein, unknown function [Plasmodium vivax]|uniref:(malaria parasite P. vivax) hypothetical protein n=1 Tax=Plasmodium vivax TaxID=5855 RepID=A0A1G4HFY6_PLAVI|nr:unnamed protein product [Plasmodium vivax]SCO73743.1 conserved Plasmodium protein, unknown function [Plasmodium vivax]